MQAVRERSGDNAFAAMCGRTCIVAVLAGALPSRDAGVSRAAAKTLLALGEASPEVREGALRYE